ncbi:HU family DNA-binding protein [Streptomyces sp. NPDC049954]|uniref:HU family DNA-binding protein n=1 Tax=Streptomyces sp. NPDC049954 TaxID=3155779 RepID=UPI0034167C1E
MDRSGLIEAVARGTAGEGAPSPGQIGAVVDALFGTVERSGAIAQALKAGHTVTLVGFGAFASEDGAAALRPGRALEEFLHDEVG